jgi:4-nitrophenyl phosphatase
LDELEPPICGLILDGDGVLWRDAEPLGDLVAIFGALRRRGLKVVIATNNAMHRADHYSQKLLAFGVRLDPASIVTSAEATADALALAFPDRGSVYVVGEQGVMDALRAAGFGVVTDPQAGGSVRAVVAGIDHELTYAKLQRASDFIRAGASFYGTNPDPTYPTPSGLVPGAGSILAAIRVASGQEPLIIGKPAAALFEAAARRMALEPAELVVVGDRLETDIRGGQSFGARTAVVLSGVSTAEEAAAWMPAPTIIAASLSALLGV